MTEYLAENSRLRQLSRRYSENQISLEEFRAGRREIIEALEAGETLEGAGEPESPAVAEPAFSRADLRLPDDSTVILKTMPPQVLIPAEPAPAWDGNARMLAAVLAVSLLVAVGALTYVFIL
jgi:hypothetical protein